jgi:glucose-1-phosphate thymidylyltransferase
MNRKGIILAGGSGTRLYPLTLASTKCLLPVYDKPMIYYSLSTLMLADITEILIITTPSDLTAFKNLLGDGSEWGISLSYEIQPKPEGIAQALIIGEKHIKNNPSALMLADNIFYGSGFSEKLQNATNSRNNTLFSYTVSDPERFGVCELDKDRRVISLEEKPKIPKSNLAVTGLYFYDDNVSEIAKSIKPSKRGELEITDVNIEYMKQSNLYSEILGRGFAWIDAGTNQSYLDASNFVYTIEKRQGLKISCPEEIAFKKGWISREKVFELSQKFIKSDYGKYLMNLINHQS